MAQRPPPDNGRRRSIIDKIDNNYISVEKYIIFFFYKNVIDLYLYNSRLYEHFFCFRKLWCWPQEGHKKFIYFQRRSIYLSIVLSIYLSIYIFLDLPPGFYGRFASLRSAWGDWILHALALSLCFNHFKEFKYIGGRSLRQPLCVITN